MNLSNQAIRELRSLAEQDDEDAVYAKALLEATADEEESGYE